MSQRRTVIKHRGARAIKSPRTALPKAVEAAVRGYYFARQSWQVLHYHRHEVDCSDGLAVTHFVVVCVDYLSTVDLLRVVEIPGVDRAEIEEARVARILPKHREVPIPGRRGQ